MNFFDDLKLNWKNYFRINRNRNFFISTLIFVSLILFFFTNFLQFVENREGFSFRDPILVLFNPIDLTWLIFAMIYSGLIFALISLFKSPRILSTALLTYGIMVLIRIISMYSLPLNPPETMIALEDPFVEFFGGGKTLTKDLFFSGHTATSFIFYLTSVNKKIKMLFLILTVIMGLSVLLMHVHYTVDVVAAPLASFASYRISKKIIKKFEKID
ncbi:MAG: phosphatase PAP2 family protein [Melioribacteraceae bacterium]|nr:phosphatase PAP2 family protein [Melioribacteraceae bacterium]